jgi:hypothetical protein
VKIRTGFRMMERHSVKSKFELLLFLFVYQANINCVFNVKESLGKIRQAVFSRFIEQRLNSHNQQREYSFSESTISYRTDKSQMRVLIFSIPLL